MSKRSQAANKVLKLLKEYKCMVGRAKIIRADIEDKKQLLTLKVAASTSRVSTVMAGGCQPNSSIEERIIERHENLITEIAELDYKAHDIECSIKHLNNSLDALDKADRTIIYNRYVEGFSWQIVARSAMRSISSSQRRSERILESLAYMMFGPDAWQSYGNEKIQQHNRHE